MCILPNCGPHSPKIIVPTHDPTIPAIIFPRIPPGTSLPKIKPAIHPMIKAILLLFFQYLLLSTSILLC